MYWAITCPWAMIKETVLKASATINKLLIACPHGCPPGFHLQHHIWGLLKRIISRPSDSQYIENSRQNWCLHWRETLYASLKVPIRGQCSMPPCSEPPFPVLIHFYYRWLMIKLLPIALATHPFAKNRNKTWGLLRIFLLIQDFSKAIDNNTFQKQ